ncbi:MAG: excinuclease ABC subunit UvrC [bacterium]|nr:excinuclease ABC subunit UvrC [bacterium]
MTTSSRGNASQIKSKLKYLPEEPGVYLFKDTDGRIIYIGKAVSLSKRVKSYFQNRPALPKNLMLISKIADFDYIVANSEVEALMLENNLIKAHKPRYNINLRDDKTYPLVKITTQEDFPRILTTRRVIDDGARYFGPYASSGDLRKTLKLIKEIFQIRSCKNKLTGRKKPTRACLNYHIKRCLAPCTGNIRQEEYQKMVGEVCLFLSGRVKELITELELRMRQEAQALRFEKAAMIRDQIQALQKVMTKQRVVSLSRVDQDVFGLAQTNRLEVIPLEAMPLEAMPHSQEGITARGITSKDIASICVVVFLIRGGRLIGEEHYFLKRHCLETGLKESLSEWITAFVKQYYDQKTSLPQELILPCTMAEQGLIKQWLEKKAGARIKICVPRRGEKKHLIDLATKNANLSLSAQKNQEKTEILISMQNYLKLPLIPTRIEAFDISCLFGKDAVGSLVVFEEGKPKKGDYRRFKIKGPALPNDVGMLKEVVTRRYSRLLTEKKPLPDLIVVDGGKAQLNTAWNVLHSLGIQDIPLISMAKPQSAGENDRIFTLSSCFTPGHDSPVLHLLQHIRYEAHRFAISYHRKIRRR